MNHPHVRVNRLQAKHSGSLLSPDVVQLTAAELKAERDRAVCCEELSEEASLSWLCTGRCGMESGCHRQTPESRAH
ncbi:hypothetical protein PBY51_011624 [Eleginops maclovinus]|uniref:Uncharacterized protein n=1 Tax=Eleginops maclovinus TaxID=56733 RepID=A0AAN7XUK5_ELEMC|nr:hypothetical protein PBY51_011624 [Eleginops maclovinus]